MFYQSKSLHTAGENPPKDFQPSNHQARCLITVYNETESQGAGKDRPMSFKTPLIMGMVHQQGTQLVCAALCFAHLVLTNLASSVQFSAVNVGSGLFY